MKRREFIRNAGLVATWAGIAVVLHGCSDDDDPVDPGNPSDDVDGIISANHGHSVRITGAQIETGEAVKLTLTGGTHTHSVDLTQDQVGQIGSGQTVSVTSTTGSAHTHQVTFN